MRQLKTVDAVVDTLGGVPAVCKLMNANRKQAWNWVARAKQFPAWTYPDMQEALKRRNATAPKRLWSTGRKRIA
jgi:hypothetical protein